MKRFLLSLIWVITWLFLIIGSAFSQSKYSQQTELEVHNTSSLINVAVEVKCDWRSKEQKYTFWDYITVRRSSKKTILVPWGLRKCEIYGKVVF